MPEEKDSIGLERMQHRIELLRKDHEAHVKQTEREVKDLGDDLANVRKDLSNNYVSRVEYAPIQKTVFGMVWLVLTSVVGAVVTFFIRKG